MCEFHGHRKILLSHTKSDALIEKLDEISENYVLKERARLQGY